MTIFIYRESIKVLWLNTISHLILKGLSKALACFLICVTQDRQNPASGINSILEQVRDGELEMLSFVLVQ